MHVSIGTKDTIHMRRTLIALLCLVTLPAQAALTPEQAAENQPITPFRIIGDVYYVGASDLASYLIGTSGGLVLLDGGFAETAPLIERNITRLGFRPADVKILLNGHAHPDHAGGLAALKRDTGAAFYAMGPEVVPLEHNGQGTFYRGNRRLFASVHVDHVLHDGETITLGRTTLTAHLTAGHTPGCTTWTMKARQGGITYDVVFMCQLMPMSDESLLHNPDYPRVAQDYGRTFAVLSRMPCDVFLGEHGYMFDLEGKLGRAALYPAVNPFIDPAGCRRYVAQSRQEFEAELQKERRAHH